jgi:hypothetical protein
LVWPIRSEPGFSHRHEQAAAEPTRLSDGIAAANDASAEALDAKELVGSLERRPELVSPSLPVDSRDRVGARLPGRDVETGAELTFLPLEGVLPGEQRGRTQSARRYGLHATLNRRSTPTTAPRRPSWRRPCAPRRRRLAIDSTARRDCRHKFFSFVDRGDGLRPELLGENVATGEDL